MAIAVPAVIAVLAVSLINHRRSASAQGESAAQVKVPTPAPAASKA